MPSLLRNRLSKRVLRPAVKLVEQRIDHRVNRRVEHIGKPLREELAALRGQLEEMRRRQYAVDLLLDGTGRGASRIPPAHEVDTLVRQTSEVTGSAEHARRSVVVAYRTVVALEALGVGRLAGSTSNICGKLATVPLLSPPNGSILEIGTLYGLFATALVRMVHRAGIEPDLTIVDPLAGLQLQPGAKQGADPTGTPVREDVVRANLALGASRAALQARIQQGFSSDPEVRAAVSDRAYGVVIVDGDHSMEGVTADLEWVEEIAAPGGIVVLDDYGDNKWPGVQEALDKHLAGGETRLRLLGRVSTSAFLRAD
ncbi:class I SAM-dependent methyltransferase [Streptomyces sp. HNM0663]|uniref:Class I SAM-dependent methyltransferase n=1 Tax=Streptomyces chengmaiensis TaxID=3040919 RepID=A0ABT6HM42_9ACTN|nr:class I SAM-dependent methyltransferase [Streptomyces chengmaiensis]MDH2389801.1 class I SAM-dependent methyltransferase [Streptomyces chengmaiensis]